MKILRIFKDDFADDPRAIEESGSAMFCLHKKWLLGDKGVEFIKNHENYSGWGDFERALTKEKYIYLPLYLLDHSGLVIKTTPFDDPWDSGKIGYIYISRENARKELGVKRISKNSIEVMLHRLQVQVDIYNDYLCGEQYYAQTYDTETKEYSEYIYGFSGSNPNINGMKSYFVWDEVRYVDS